MHAAMLGETGADAGYGGDGGESATLDGKWHVELVISRGDTWAWDLKGGCLDGLHACWYVSRCTFRFSLEEVRPTAR